MVRVASVLRLSLLNLGRGVFGVTVYLEDRPGGACTIRCQRTGESAPCGYSSQREMTGRAPNRSPLPSTKVLFISGCIPSQHIICYTSGGGANSGIGPAPNSLPTRSSLGTGDSIPERGGMISSIVEETGIPSLAKYSSFQKREWWREPASLEAAKEMECERARKRRTRVATHHRIVTTVFPLPSLPHFCANRTQATRLTAEDEPRKRPSSRAR